MTKRVAIIAHGRSAALAVALAAVNESETKKVETMDTPKKTVKQKITDAASPAKLTSTQREKKMWDLRKRQYLAAREKYGSYVNKPRAIQYLSGQNPAAPADPMTRQGFRAMKRAAAKELLSEAKAYAMEQKNRGGAAAVLSVEVG